MKSPRSILFAALLLASPVVAMTVAPQHAEASEIGAKILAEVDRQAESFQDQAYTASMDIIRGGEVKKTLVFNMTMKGLQKQYIEFTAPGEVAGMKVLMAGKNELWMYNTEFKKVRKVAAHAESQGFFGSDFTAEDMVLAKLSEDFDAEVKGKSGGETTLELTPKAGVQVSFAKLEIVIDASKGGVTKISYLNDKGQVTRVQKRGGWKKVNGKAMPTEISMENPKTGGKTVIKLSDVKVNQGISDDLFSKRTLLR